MLFSSWLHNWKRSLERRSARSRTRRRKPPLRGVVPRPRLEALEDRTLLSIFTVTNTGDNNGVDPLPGAGTGTLRQAIVDANAAMTGTQANPDVIRFNIPTSDPSTVFTIQPLSFWVTIKDTVIINGYTQTGASANTNWYNTASHADNAAIRIELNGGNLTGSDEFNNVGLAISSDYSTVEGLAINGFGGSNLYVTGNYDKIQGNFIGTNAAGTQTAYTPNLSTTGSVGGPIGIHISGGTGDVIGTTGQDGANDPAERNVIAGNNYGVALRTTTNSVVAGNFIGTDSTGAKALGNFVGIGTLGGANGARIGTNGTDADVAGETNIISGNAGGIAFGVGDPVPAESGGKVYGNSIGLDVNGSALGNTRAGIFVGEGSTNTKIGGPGNLANTISNTDSGPGVWILDFRGAPTGIRVQGNSIYNNGGLGIDLGGSYPTPGPDGVTLNDSNVHDGPNNFQNFPTLTSASSSATSTSISGTFSEAAEGSQTLTLDFYANSTGSATTYGQGQTYLGSRTVVTDPSGNVSFNAAFALGSLAGDWVSGTATDANGNTSEFSQDIQVSSAPSQTFTQILPAALPQSTTSTNTLTIQADTTTINDVVAALSPSNLGSSVVPVSVYLNLAPGTYQQQTVQIPQGMTLYINGVPGTTIDPDAPAFTVTSGNVVVSNVTFVTTGDAPTILVTGGNLTLRNDTIQESTGATDAAISISGGTVDLGTAADPGGNTLNINGSGDFIQNATSNPITAVGSTFLINGASLAPDGLSGIVFEDFNDDGQVDFGERGIAGVAVTLTGTDFLGNAVSMSATTDSDGAYIFASLQPGTYDIIETQPAGYLQGTDTVGTAGGILSATDQFFVSLPQDAIGLNGLNYNFGEQPGSTGPVQPGQTAGIGFWNNKNGQALIKSFNGGQASTQLGDWLAATLPNMFGANAGSNDLTGTSNADVAALFQSDFLVKGVKLDAQVLATALSVYATNATLDDTEVAANYGFIVSGNGLGTATVNVGSNGAAFGVADNTVLTVLDLLKATDAQAVGGLLYNGDATLRKEANRVYSAINEEGDVR